MTQSFDSDNMDETVDHQGRNICEEHSPKFESWSPAFTDSKYSNAIPRHLPFDFRCLAYMIQFHKFQSLTSALVSGIANGFLLSRAPFRQSPRIVIIPFLQLIKSSVPTQQVVVLYPHCSLNSWS